MTHPHPDQTASREWAERIASDVEFLGLRAGERSGRFLMVVEDRLSRFDGRLYGGTAIAASIAAAERVSGRSALWMTTQFVSSAESGVELAVDVEVLADGKRTQQLRVTATDPAGAVVFASLGAAGFHREGGLNGFFEAFPTVAGPSDSGDWTSPFAAMARELGTESPQGATSGGSGFNTLIEVRYAELIDHPDPGPGRVCLWIRRRDGRPVTPAMAAFMADMVPLSVARAFGLVGGGTSLDNTIRIGEFGETEWILLDLRPHMAAGDYGHGVGHVWSEDGRLLATASQTASMRLFGPLTPPPLRSGS